MIGFRSGCKIIWETWCLRVILFCCDGCVRVGRIVLRTSGLELTCGLDLSPDALRGCQVVSESLLVFKASSSEFSTAVHILVLPGFITVSFLALLTLFLSHNSCRIQLPELLLGIFLLPKEIPTLICHGKQGIMFLKPSFEKLLQFHILWIFFFHELYLDLRLWFLLNGNEYEA